MCSHICYTLCTKLLILQAKWVFRWVPQQSRTFGAYFSFDRLNLFKVPDLCLRLFWRISYLLLIKTQICTFVETKWQMSISSVLVSTDSFHYFRIVLSTLLALLSAARARSTMTTKKSCLDLKTKCLFNLCEQQYKRWSDGRNTNVSYRKGGNS